MNITKYSFTKPLTREERLAMKADEIAMELADAKAEGEAEKAREMVVGMLCNGIDKSIIAEISQLTPKEVERMLVEDDVQKLS